ncbi:MAG: ArsR family transcriptional regulator [Myxococcales bacterium]|nr:ArsR family transcriptional regulator [Myxococcales bacterium]
MPSSPIDPDGAPAPPEPLAEREGCADTEAPEDGLWESERVVSEAVGRLMVLWGFKRNMGRVWTILFLSDRPLTGRQLQERLSLSSGAVSMTLSELARWGVVNKEWVPGDRRDYHIAEGNLWKMISRVLRERERGEIEGAIEAFEDALAALERKARRGGSQARIELQRERIGRLLELARLGRSMLDALIANARMDATWLPRFRLGRRG